MRSRIYPLNNILTTLAMLLFCGTMAARAQTTGSLMMLPENFHAQMNNPAYLRGDDAIVVALPGLAGFGLRNYGNFKISDLIATTSAGKPELDFQRFASRAKPNNRIGQIVSVPLLFVGVPIDKGMVSFYYGENLATSTQFKINSVDFLMNGNFPQEYRAFSTEDIALFALGYREFAFGYTRQLSKKIDVGARIKVLFGSAFSNITRWNYGIETSAGGNEVRLISKGHGQMYLPVPVVLTEIGKIDGLEAQNAFGNYFGDYRNPGFAFDFGLNYKHDGRNRFSFAIRDLGAIWFHKNALELTQNGNYKFDGFDVASAILYSQGNGYIDPALLMKLEKENIRDVYRPFADSTEFTVSLSPKTVLHYQYDQSPGLSFALTNQTVLSPNNFFNLLTAGTLQKTNGFSFFESLSWHNFKNITLGAGFQYEGKFAQLFVAADNILAFYHPAGNKNFNISVGASLLFNHQKTETRKNKNGSASNNGKTNHFFPFFRQRD